MVEIKAILIDDEQSARNVLTNLLSRSATNITILASCSTLEIGVQKIKELQPDVVFLDVQMPNYAGYEIARFFDVIPFEIIFVTAYDYYAIKAFELNAVDYLVKPIDRNKLNTALTKLENKLKQQASLVNYHSLLKTIKDKNYKKIVIPELGNRHIINLADIVAIEADGAYSKIHLVNKTAITASKNLKFFENILTEEPSFFRSHRAWIVNLTYIEFLNKTTLTLILDNGTITAKISRSRISSFENCI